MLNKPSYSVYLPYLISIGIPAVLLLGLYWPVLWVAVSLAAVFGMALFLFKKNWINYLIIITTFALPLSSEVELTEGVKLLFPSEPMLVIVAISITLVLLRRGFDWALHRRFIYTLVFFIVALVAASVFSSDIIISIKYTLVYGLYLYCFYWGFYYLKSGSKDYEKLFFHCLLAYSISYLLVFFMALLTWAGHQFNPITITGIFEPFYADHTIFGASGVALTLFWFLRFLNKFKSSSVFQRFGHLLFILLCLSSVLVSGSRAAILSMPFALVLCFLIKNGFNFKHFAITFLALLGLGFIFYQDLNVLLNQNDYNSRDENANFAEKTASAANVHSDVSNVERINRWVAAVKMFEEKPILGFGPGTFQYEYIPFQQKKWMNRLSVKNAYDTPENSGGTVHSEPLIFLSETGILGFVAWLLLMMSWLYRAVSLKSESVKAAAMLPLAIIASYWLHGMFNNFLNTDKFAFLFWGSAGYLMALSAQKLKSIHED